MFFLRSFTFTDWLIGCVEFWVLSFMGISDDGLVGHLQTEKILWVEIVSNRDQWVFLIMGSFAKKNWAEMWDIEINGYLFLMMGHVQKPKNSFELRGEETEINGDFWSWVILQNWEFFFGVKRWEIESSRRLTKSIKFWICFFCLLLLVVEDC